MPLSAGKYLILWGIILIPKASFFVYGQRRTTLRNQMASAATATVCSPGCWGQSIYRLTESRPCFCQESHRRTATCWRVCVAPIPENGWYALCTRPTLTKPYPKSKANQSKRDPNPKPVRPNVEYVVRFTDMPRLGLQRGFTVRSDSTKIPHFRLFLGF